MENKLIDLHVHSTCSDGTLSPAELVEYALKKGLSAIALTDHDTFKGVSQALTASKGTDLEVIPGIEFSTVYEGCDVHIVGLDIDIHNEMLLSHMENFIRSRDLRNLKIAQAMEKDGIDISVKKLNNFFGDTVLTRAHIGRYLLEKGYVSSIDEAFTLYLGEGCKYHIPRKKITPHEVINLIYKTGGIPILAHPMLYHLSDEQLHTLIRELSPLGLIGIEALYSTYSPEEEAYVKELAFAYHLELSGGSDFHGTNKPNLDLGTGYGNLSIPYEILTNLREKRRSL